MEDNKQSLDLEKLFSLDGLKIIETKEELQKNGKLLVTLFTELKNRPSRICPECDHKNVYSHGYGERTIDDLPMFGKDAKVVFNYQRFRCTDCGTLFQDNIDDFASAGSSISNRLREAIVRDGAMFGFTNAANRYGGSVTNSKNIFNEWAQYLE